jgi:lipopolysaccharide export LptBFGC system permease protein LptF
MTRMPFPWTLQRYILREMAKTFLLAAIALTAVLGLGGGLRAMIKLGEVTPGQLLRIMALVLPLAGALTLPVATLFSAAATYGRLSGDNEFVACRASGVNLHWLFLPGIALSLVSAAVTFCFINFVVPGMTKNLNDFISGDIGVFIQHRLADPKGFKLRQYRLTADRSAVEHGEKDSVTLRKVAFVEMENDEWARYGTADALQAVFQRSGEGARLTGWLRGLSFYDRQAGHFVDLAEQTLAAEELRSLVPMKIKFLNLVELGRYWLAPQTWVEAADAVNRARAVALGQMVMQRVWQDWEDDRSIQIADASATYTLRATAAERLSRDGGITLSDCVITRTDERTRTYSAARAMIEFARADALADAGLRIEAYEVSAEGAATRRTKEVFGPVSLPSDLAKTAADLSIEELLRREGEAAAGDARPSSRRAGLADVLAETVRSIAATMHERTAFSVSVLALVVLAAALGIILRGSHVVIAFGISFVPAILVIIGIMMGKQLAQNAATHTAGLVVIWAGIVAVGVVDWWVMTRVLRR